MNNVAAQENPFFLIDYAWLIFAALIYLAIGLSFVESQAKKTRKYFDTRDPIYLRGVVWLVWYVALVLAKNKGNVFIFFANVLLIITISVSWPIWYIEAKRLRA